MKKVFIAITLLMLVQLIYAQDSSINKKNISNTSTFLNPNIYKPEMAGDRDPFLWQMDGSVGIITRYHYGDNGAYKSIPSVSVGDLGDVQYLGYVNQNNSAAGVYVESDKGAVYQISGDFKNAHWIKQTPPNLKNDYKAMFNAGLIADARRDGEKIPKLSNLTISKVPAEDSSSAAVASAQIQRTSSNDTFKIIIPAGQYLGTYKAMPLKAGNNLDNRNIPDSHLIGAFIAIPVDKNGNSSNGQNFNSPTGKFYLISIHPDGDDASKMVYQVKELSPVELKYFRQSLGIK